MSGRFLAPGFCLNCGHHEDAHLLDEEGVPSVCVHEVCDHGDMDCSCEGLRLCAACEGDPEALDRHVCARGSHD
jgi:hypothetical protein